LKNIFETIPYQSVLWSQRRK